jgi:hypothetical protein
MSQPRLIIHAGFHKSGTTALQESFNSQKIELRQSGLIYPDIGRKAHHRTAWALSGRTWGWNKKGGEKTSKKEWTDIAKAINSNKTETILLSSEFFSELTKEEIHTIFNDIKGRKIEAIFTLRPLVKLLGSSYQQYLKYGITADYVSWLHSVLDNPGESKINPTFWMRHFHGKVVAKWVEVLGANNVTVLIVDESKPEFLYDSINQYLGLSKDFIKPQKAGSNRSLNLEEIALLLELNRQFPKDRKWKEYEVFIRDGYIRRLTDEVKAPRESSKLLTPRWAIEKGNEIGSQSKSELLASGAIIIGDIESLGSASVPEGEPVYPTEISIIHIAQGMLAFDQDLVNKLPTKWMRDNLIKRYRRKLRKQILRSRKKI